jgi:hypothetical protein
MKKFLFLQFTIATGTLRASYARWRTEHVQGRNHMRMFDVAKFIFG